MSDEMWFLNHAVEEPDGLSTRTQNCILNAWKEAHWTHAITPENIAKFLTVGDLQRQPNFGKKSLAELQGWLGAHGYQLSVVPFGQRFRVEMEERAELARLKAKYE